jgi:alkaline phosphatase
MKCSVDENVDGRERTMNRRASGDCHDRRRFLKAATAGLGIGAAGALAGRGKAETGDDVGEKLIIGLVTDVHYADADTRGTRHYRDSLGKLEEAVDRFNRLGASFAMELGDLLDAGPSKEDDLKFLREVDRGYRRFRGPRYYVLGNHCLHALTKTEFLSHSGAEVKKSFYSFDRGGRHFIVLDANFKQDGQPYAAGNFAWTDTWIPAAVRKWLAEDLERAGGKRTFVFIHQNLHDEKDPHGVKNAPQVRRILESAGNVAAVFQGHMHTGGYAKIGGIHYCTLAAMVEGAGLESNAHAVLLIDPTGRPRLEGSGRQPDVSFA